MKFTIEFRDKDGVLLWSQVEEVTIDRTRKTAEQEYTYRFHNVAIRRVDPGLVGFVIPVEVSPS